MGWFLLDFGQVLNRCSKHSVRIDCIILMGLYCSNCNAMMEPAFAKVRNKMKMPVARMRGLSAHLRPNLSSQIERSLNCRH